MRVSDWSSDVCSSDLSIIAFFVLPLAGLVMLSLTGPAADGTVVLSLANYATLFDLSTGRLDVLGRTLRIGFIVVGLSALIAVPVGYYLAKLLRSPKLRARKKMV